MALPVSTIAGLLPMNLWGLADNPDEMIELKIFHSRFIIDNPVLDKEKESYPPIPNVRRINRLVRFTVDPLQQKLLNFSEI
ncbi:MAG TPA: hypothetical protein VK616_03360 [Flavitalea sp.]|nr:hypothetical protein [Flavitalea sp.]